MEVGVVDLSSIVYIEKGSEVFSKFPLLSFDEEVVGFLSVVENSLCH